MKTPELEKINANRDDSQRLGEFIEWLLNKQDLRLCTYEGECDGDNNGEHGIYTEYNLSIEKLLALYFEIDLSKAEKERQGLLAELREQGS